MTDIMTNVSGDATLDPGVANGIIVFSDPDNLRSQYYTNTSSDLLAPPDTARFTVNFSANNGPSFLQDVYIFRTNERGREVHLPGFSGTEMADPSFYNTGDDVNGTYKTLNGLPWGIDLTLDGINFKHPREKIDILNAYSQFAPWASSEGSSNSDWYLYSSAPEVIDLQQ